MTSYLRAMIGVSLVVLWLQVSVFAAEKVKPTPAAPIPQQILAAKKIFIANAGGDERWYEKPIFNGGAVRAYDEFYALVKTAGQYEIVAASGDADLLLEIGLTAPMVSRGGDSDPQFRLVIRDPKTNVLLWAFTEHVQWAFLQENRDKNFDETLARIISDLRSLSASSDR